MPPGPIRVEPRNLHRPRQDRLEREVVVLDVEGGRRLDLLDSYDALAMCPALLFAIGVAATAAKEMYGSLPLEVVNYSVHGLSSRFDSTCSP